MQSIRSAVFHTAQPVARSAGTQFAKMQSSFAKGFLRGGSAAASLQSYHPYQRRGFCVGGCVTPNSQKHIRSLQKHVCAFLCFTGKLFV